MKFHHSWFVIPVALALHAGVFAQSLADVAKAEEVRRKGIKGTAKVYTNEDLSGTPPTSPAPAQSAAAASTAAKPGDPAKPGEEKPVDPKTTQAYWKERATTIQQSLSRGKLLLEALQSQVNGLNAEFVNMDDPGQRELLQARLQRASGELLRVQQDIEKQTKAAADLQTEARRANIPPGWVR
jgi:hypothetical protein